MQWIKHEPKHGSVYYTADHGKLMYSVITYSPSTPALGWFVALSNAVFPKKYKTAQEAMDAVDNKEVTNGNKESTEGTGEIK